MEDCHIRGMPTLGELPHKGICTYLQHDMNFNVLFQYIVDVNLQVNLDMTDHCTTDFRI